LPTKFTSFSLTEKQYADVMSLRHKLERDGVELKTTDAVERGLCVNEKDRDLTLLMGKYGSPRD
jgi:hypothetical protein